MNLIQLLDLRTTVGTIALLILSAMTLAYPPTRAKLLARRARDWFIDLACIAVIPILIPLLQMGVTYALYLWIIPSFKQSLTIHPAFALLLNPLLVDYLWYWNHRLFHAPTPIWNIHATHHSAPQLDVLVSFRSSIWSPLFTPYIWVNALAVFSLKDPGYFLLGGILGGIINFWVHTSFGPKPGSSLYQVVSLALITPHDHSWHHNSSRNSCNFGTVFNFWDKWHGTWYSPQTTPLNLGLAFRDSAWKEFFFPFY